eukprot:1147248-Pleurochrysis_carterae.AAC.3
MSQGERVRGREERAAGRAGRSDCASWRTRWSEAYPYLEPPTCYAVVGEEDLAPAGNLAVGT